MKLHIWPTFTAPAWKHMDRKAVWSPLDSVIPKDTMYSCPTIPITLIVHLPGARLCSNALDINSFNPPSNPLRNYCPCFMEEVTELQGGRAACLRSESMTGKAICDWQNSTMSPTILPSLSVYTLKNFPPFSMDRTHKDEGISLYWLDYVIWQGGGGFENISKAPHLLILSISKGKFAWVGLTWSGKTSKRGSRPSLERESEQQILLLTLKKPTAMFWRPVEGVTWQEPESGIRC